MRGMDIFKTTDLVQG